MSTITNLFVNPINGNVGIGTYDPTEKLVIASQGSRSNAIKFMTDDGPENNQLWNTGRIVSGWDISENAWNKSYICLQTHATGTNVFTDDLIIKGGKIGIGTTNPSNMLALGGDGAAFSSPFGNSPLYAARAWVAFTGTTGAILQQGNIASVTRNTTGAYNIAFTTAMPDVNYAVIVSTSKTDTNYNTTSGWLLYGGSVSRTVNGFNAITWYPSSTYLADTAYGTYIVVYR